MSRQEPHRLPAEPPPSVADALRRRLMGPDLPALEAVFALRMTAQQADNAITSWMANTAGTPARFQILALLWASEAGGVPHREIVKTLGVTRATVSGLMSALERDGLVQSFIDRDDRRNLIAVLTAKGREVFDRAIDVNRVALRGALASLSAEEVVTLTALLRRLRQGFVSARTSSAHGATSAQGAGQGDK